MFRCDVSHVSKCLYGHLKENSGIVQDEFYYLVFAGYVNAGEDVYIDPAAASKWINGITNISPEIVKYYQKKEAINEMAGDFEFELFPLLDDYAMAVQEIYDLLVADPTVSEHEKKRLFQLYRKETEGMAVFVAEVFVFAMLRRFVRHTQAGNAPKLESKGLSPDASDLIFGADVPKGCRNFFGRERELEELHERMQEESAVFVYGEAGMGKSELVKHYAKRYKKEYRNILYFHYSGSLVEMITSMDMLDDREEDSQQERFSKHYRGLRTLKEDTLIIIDNFNTTAMEEEFLETFLKHRYKVIFTTRSRFSYHAEYEIKPIKKKEDLFRLFACYYSQAEEEKDIIFDVIDVVYAHTLTVELAAKLLESGLVASKELLAKLKEEGVDFETTEKIVLAKDGRQKKAIYYKHLSTLFSLYDLSEEKKQVLRSMSLMPFTGVARNQFARWNGYSNCNEIHDLIEMGLIQSDYTKRLFMHPLTREVAEIETKPTVSSCGVMLENVEKVCLLHGEDIKEYKQFFVMIESIKKYIYVEDSEENRWLLFLENAFSYMEKYEYREGMRAIIDELSDRLQAKEVGTAKDRALLLDCQASFMELFEGKTKKAISLTKQAIETCGDIEEGNAHLLSNLHANLGYLYHKDGQLEQARLYMEKGYKILEEYGLMQYHDSLAQVRNHANLLADMGEWDEAMNVLKKCCRLVKEMNGSDCLDFAYLQYNMGALYLQSGRASEATTRFKKAFAIFADVFVEETERLEEMYEDVQRLYVQAGVGIGKGIEELYRKK